MTCSVLTAFVGLGVGFTVGESVVATGLLEGELLGACEGGRLGLGVGYQMK